MLTLQIPLTWQILKKKKSHLWKKGKIQKLKIKNVNKSCSVLSKNKQCNKENHLKIIVNYSEIILIIQSQHMIFKLHYEIYVMIIHWYYWYSILYFDILSKIFLKMYSLLAWLARSFWNTWNKTWKIFFGGVFHPLFWKILGKHCFYPEVHLFPLFSLAAMKKIIKFTKLYQYKNI